MPRPPLLVAASILSLLSFPLSAFAAYTWPEPQYDTLESLLYEGRRSDASNLASLVHPCRKRAGTMASVPAEWLRFAFHDMATHNVDDGTGGMDGSIVYELNRPENFGLGFNQTLSDFEIYPNKLVSRGDVIALGAVFSVATCGGPIIPFRGGRIDTWSPGGLGTPEPQHDLATLSESFRKQGFNQEEMIKMVACGHSFGGVRSDDFPQLVPPDPNSQNPVIVDFDTTPEFDNLVVTEYLGGHSQNRLVVSGNATMNSDLRVFEADGNRTMSSLSDPAVYQSECQSILSRMIDVVPSGVSLTDPITLVPVKANNAQLTIEQGQLVFKVSLRVAESLTANPTIPTSRKVSLFWCDKYGSGADCSGSQSTNVATPVRGFKEDPNLSPITLKMGYYFMTYNFVVPISGDASIGRFWFEIDDTAWGGQKVQYTNGAWTPPPSSADPSTLATATEGKGFVYPEDGVFFVPMMSHVDLYADGAYTKTYTNRDGQNYTRMYDLVVAVRSDLSPSRVYIDATDVAVPFFAFPVIQNGVDLQKNTSMGSVGGYEFWTGRFESAGVQLTMDVHADVGNPGSGGKTRTQTFAQTTLLDNTPFVKPSSNSTKVGDRLDGGASARFNGGWMSMAWTLLAIAGVMYVS